MLQKKLANLGTLLSRDAQKKIVGGNEEPIDSKGSCAAGDRIAHCFWIGGSCGDQGWGGCAGHGSNCEVYCVRQNGSTYYP